MNKDFESTQELAASITKTASLQTYYTVRFLVDRELVPDAYRAYAYFRWVDDWLDQETRQKHERIAFVNRQASLIDKCIQGNPAEAATPEEQMLAHLIQRNPGKDNGLHSYIRNMLAVMAFDAERRDRLISNAELNVYAQSLAVAVTEALHYFIGRNCASPHYEARYLAATGAHVTHMLRDTLEDNEVGYFNIPREVLAANGISPRDVESEAYRAWVRSRVELAHTYFRVGRDYLAHVENLRCRLAGYAYIARFEAVLDSIERDSYSLRRSYHECKTLRAGVQMSRSILWSALNVRPAQAVSDGVTVR